MNRNKFFIMELLIVVVLAAFDLLTKQLAVKYLSDGNLTLIPGYFWLLLLL